MRMIKILGKIKSKDRVKRNKEIIKTLLKNRGLHGKKAENDFFNPINPLDIEIDEIGITSTQIKKAIARINSAIKNNEGIIVYGDYDADGVSATAILWETIYVYHKKIMPYLPHRVEEGYGLSIKGIDNLNLKYKPKLIITVDNGITSIEAVRYASEKGIDVIITDHHIKPKKMPKAFSVIHTTKISGSGVAWFVSREFLKSKEKDYKTVMSERLSLASIGTVSDMLPLININRSIVYFGIEELKKSKRPGLNAIFKEAGIIKEHIEAYHLGYIIGPRINATGRISHSIDSLRILCTTSEEKAEAIATVLGDINRERQKITEEHFISAKSQVSLINNKITNNLLIISDKTFNQGVIGLVAGKLVDEFYRPTIVISQGDMYSKASARSIDGFNIISVLRSFSNLLVDCGGHPMAAGFTIETSKIDYFNKQMITYANNKIKPNMLNKITTVDCEISFKDINRDLLKQIEKFKPLGFGNPEPRFLTKNLAATDARLVGKGKHLKIKLTDINQRVFGSICFNQSEDYFKIKKESCFDIVYTIYKNDWNGKIELNIKKIIQQNQKDQSN